MGAYVDDWSWAISSSLYSQLTGVLSGFAFTAIVVLITNFPKTEKIEEIGQPATSLLLSFIGLIMSSFLFAFITGYIKSDKTIMLMDFCGTIASYIFATCMIQMFLSLVLLLEIYGFPLIILKKAHSAYRGVGFLAIFYTVSTIVETKLLQEEMHGYKIYILIMLFIVFFVTKGLLLVDSVRGIILKKYYGYISIIFCSFILAGVVFETVSYTEHILTAGQFLALAVLLLGLQCFGAVVFDAFILNLRKREV